MASGLTEEDIQWLFTRNNKLTTICADQSEWIEEAKRLMNDYKRQLIDLKVKLVEASVLFDEAKLEASMLRHPAGKGGNA